MRMKKILFLIVIAVMAVMGLTSCESYGVAVGGPVYPYYYQYGLTYYYHPPHRHYKAPPPPPPAHDRHHHRR